MEKKAKKIDKQLIVRGIIAALIPPFCCLVYLLIYKKNFFDVSLLKSEWNDELFYFKEVEAILKNGHPTGYFGYNESHAAIFGLGAWSPVIILPWLLWGRIFGWGLYSPFISNMVFFSTALFFFVMFSKASWKQLIIIISAFVLFPLNIRYIFSAMPEVIIWSLILIFYGLALNCIKKESQAGIIALFVISVLLTLMRPYFILLVFLPAFLIIRQKRGKKLLFGIGISFVTMLAATFIYAVVTKFFCAEYIEPIYDTGWLEMFIKEGVKAGIVNLLSGMKNTAYTLYYLMRISLKEVKAEGTYFILHLFVLGLFFVRIIADLICLAIHRKDDKSEKKEIIGQRLPTEIHFFATATIVFIAVFIMYDLKDGSKHLLTFISTGIIILAVLGGLDALRSFAVGVLLSVLLLSDWNRGSYNYLVPFKDEELSERSQYWEKVFDKTENDISVKGISYSNTIIWVFSDPGINSGEREIPKDRAGLFRHETEWQMLYLAPKGFGINGCKGEYVYENFDNLKSGYILVIEGGFIDERCKASEIWEEAGRRDALVLYERK